ncbi:flavin monoamine oxidase family protein [Kribbella speibonae]|uniref:FAD-binding protein n=1 Tax=Kribbella speibonae TaxID=1572660 RepID=A0A4R0IT59_9ACTN|nr:FAD-dependent oxidoreductase [Kribbella speibonae]TCC36379.1 FAD-binding protein [Kribbella speibonae]
MTPPEQTAVSAYDVAVVGAGIAGLVVADQLHARGLSVRVLEARPEVGGRAVSVEVPGGYVDLGASWIWPGEDRVLELVRRFGIDLFAQATAGDAMLDVHGSVERADGNPVNVPAYRFARGARILAEHLAAGLPAGTICLSERVTRIVSTGDAGPVVVETTTGRLQCNQVVLALPPALATTTITFDPPLADPVERVARTTAVWMGQVVKAVAVYERSFWRDAGLSGAAVSYRGPFREFHDHSGPPGGQAAIFGFADSREFDGEAEIADVFRRQLVQLFGPDADRPLRIVARDWSREPHTTPSAGLSPRATTATFGHPVFRSPANGPIHWASTETATQYAGHLEGAVRAGLRAADAIATTVTCT